MSYLLTFLALIFAPAMATRYGIKNNCFFTTLCGLIGLIIVTYSFGNFVVGLNR